MKATSAKYTRILGLLILLFAGSILNAQTDTTSSTSPLDSLQIYEPGAEEVTAIEDSVIDPIDTSYHSPKKAALLALVPGLGQIYNKKYWKLPLVYGALGACIYVVDFNQFYYRSYLDQFNTLLETDSPNRNTMRQLVEQQNFYRRRRDLSIIITAAVYGLQILDAYVDAHLFHYDISDDLTLQWEPRMLRNLTSPNPNAYGLGITFNLK